jgi:hypothetical protein
MSQGISAPLASLPTGPHVHVFNDDLLMNDADLAYARSQFSSIIHVLDHPRLREKFAQYENQANEARERVRSFGFVAIFCATIALVAIATRPAWPHAPWTRWPALLIEVIGLLSAIIAVGGPWLGAWKHRWLESRLMTERLRQWHFQLLVRRGQQVEASCQSPEAARKFIELRDLWFEKFLKEHEGKLDAQLESFAKQHDQPAIWLHDMATPYANNDTRLDQVFAVYRQLRFEHQYRYAVYKLRTSTDLPFFKFLRWPEVLQRNALSGISSACFACAIVCSLILVYGHAFGLSDVIVVKVGALALTVALIGAALRAIEEGLGLDREIERYCDYRGRTFQLRERFDNTVDRQTRLHLMEELEIASVDEMKRFLGSHYNASFTL